MKWIWLPHAGHFILGNYCRYHLATVVNRHLVSTVGELWSDSRVRDILAKSRGITLVGMGDTRDADYMKKIGFEDIGFDRKYETMVFQAIADPENPCCGWRMGDGSEMDFRGYNDAGDATAGHLELCRKWEKKK